MYTAIDKAIKSIEDRINEVGQMEMSAERRILLTELHKIRINLIQIKLDEMQ